MKPKPFISLFRKNMNLAIKFILILLVCPLVLFGQSSSKLKQEQQRLEKKISGTKQLLSKTKQQTSNSLQQLRLLEQQISFREDLLRNFDNQIRSAELKIKEKEWQVSDMELRIQKLKVQYKRLLLYAYKNRNKYGKLMFLFSSGSYNEAVKRNLYLKKVAEIQQKQFHLIRQHQQLITTQITSIDNERKEKLLLVDEKKNEKEAILKDRAKQADVYQTFKQKEDVLLAQLKKDEREKAVLKQQIAMAIKREVEAAEAKRKREEAARIAAAKAKKESGPAVSIPEKEVESVPFTESSESAALGKSFEVNRGKLPWPVERGAITEQFGKNPHPTLKNVYTENRGIDIAAPKNSSVRAVFEGEVTSVLNIPGAGKVVIIKHGNYRTVYTNLKETYVKSGDKVGTKKTIGTLLTQEGESNSVAHFEVHQVVGTAVNCLNPTLWISR